MQRGFISETAANALGTLLAIAVVYLVGVIAGAFTAHALFVVLASLGIFVLMWWSLGLVAGAGWARFGIGVPRMEPPPAGGSPKQERRGSTPTRSEQKDEGE